MIAIMTKEMHWYYKTVDNFDVQEKRIALDKFDTTSILTVSYFIKILWQNFIGAWKKIYRS